MMEQTLTRICRVLPLPGDRPPLSPTAYRVRQLDRDRTTTIRPYDPLLISVAEAGFTVWRRGGALYVLPHGETPA